MPSKIGDARPAFTTIPEIIDHVSSRHAHMVWIGKEYSKADLVRDLTAIHLSYTLPPAVCRDNRLTGQPEGTSRYSHRQFVERIAYSIWEGEGRPDGQDLDHWLRAEDALSTAEEVVDRVRAATESW